MNELTRRKLSRGDRNIHWIEEYCLVPFGPDKGKRVCLTFQEQDVIHYIYDQGVPIEEPVKGRLGAFIALLHVCGREASRRDDGQDFRPLIEADLFTTWAAASPEAREVLKLVGEKIICPELGTQYPAIAA